MYTLPLLLSLVPPETPVLMLTIANHRFIVARPQQSVAIATKQLQNFRAKDTAANCSDCSWRHGFKTDSVAPWR